MSIFDVTQPSYQRLRSIVSERTSPIVFWVGAGLSIAAGCPSWAQLRERLSSTGRRAAESSDDADRIVAEIENIATIEDHWTAFGRLKEVLGDSTYRDTLRDAMPLDISGDIPQAYKDVWALRPSGVLSLNIDLFANRAAQASEAVEYFHRFDGARIKDFVHLLRTPQPFLGNLHGTWEDSSSWVFTDQELKNLKRTPGYREFLIACITTRTIVFLGISADDVAAGGHLAELASRGVDFGSHFWVTNRTDTATRDWAEGNGVQLITYDSANGHERPLAEMFEDLRRFRSEDSDNVSPVILPSAEAVTIPTEQELLRLPDAEELRRILNARANAILASAGDHATEKLGAFYGEYDEAIHRAWYVNMRAGGGCKLLGISLNEEAAQGAFGKVYRGIDRDGNDVAVKVLLEEIRRKPDLLTAFRRGVRSMKILQERDVQGMVAYREASEIPAFVVMDWIDGPNLEDAVASGQLSDWDSVLEVGLQLAKIIRAGHQLPERVLHRDLRPSNVMLQGLWADKGQIDVVVLDFDLSWHRGAIEKSVIHGAVAGYLAPEQQARIRGASTRHSAVDSFGFGMTAFFMVSRRHPTPGEQLSENWEATVASFCTPGSTWRSTANRWARLVCRCTRSKQSERWDFSVIERELQQLREAVAAPDKVASAELVAEEIAERTRAASYRWDENRATAVLSLGSGLEVQLKGDEGEQVVELKASWSSDGLTERKKLGKWIPKATSEATANLTRKGWRIVASNPSAQSFSVIATKSSRMTSSDISSAARDVDHIIDRLTFK